MAIRIIAVGTELLSGELSDTNTAEIARLLGRAGLKIRDSLTVSDRESDIVEALLSRTGTGDTVIVTGGLGPTTDDLTARAAAKAFNRRAILNTEALHQIRDHFQKAGRPMHPANEKQALLPQKATIVPNTTGSAPGFYLCHQETDFFFLPGVPGEMAVMLTDQVLPRLVEKAGGDLHPNQERILKVFGLAESRVGALIDAATLPEEIELAYGLDFPLVLVKLRASGKAAEEALDRAELAVRRVLADALIALNDGSLPQTVVHLLKGGGQTLSLAESCTGGLIARLLTDIPGVSDVFDRSAVTYSNRAKKQWLGVRQRLLETSGAVSEACASAMARGIRQQAGTTLSLAVTGIAGPDGGTEDKPVGTVYIALAAPGTNTVRRFLFPGDRDRIRTLTAYTALDLLRRHLLGLDSSGSPPESPKKISRM